MDTQVLKDRVEAEYARLVSTVKAEGHAVVGMEAGDRLPSIAFSVGAAHRRLPDVMILGINNPDGMTIINSAIDVVAQHWPFESRSEFDGVIHGRKVAFRDISRSDVLSRVMFLTKLYNARNGVEQTPILQVCWPDKDGKFPFDPSCDRAVARIQRVASLRS